jgi:hypothetical protein
VGIKWSKQKADHTPPIVLMLRMYKLNSHSPTCPHDMQRYSFTFTTGKESGKDSRVQNYKIFSRNVNKDRAVIFF